MYVHSHPDGLSGTTTPDTPESGPTATGKAGNRHPSVIECGGCGERWTGLTPCHCPACHRTFSGITAFDKHRDGNHARGTRHCLDPATMRSGKGETVLITEERNNWTSPVWRSAEERIYLES
jgi:hypothetical protein